MSLSNYKLHSLKDKLEKDTVIEVKKINEATTKDKEEKVGKNKKNK